MEAINCTGTIEAVLQPYEGRLLTPSKLRVLRDSLNRTLYTEPPHVGRLEALCLFGEIMHGKAWHIIWNIDCFRVIPAERDDEWDPVHDRVTWEETKDALGGTKEDT